MAMNKAYIKSISGIIKISIIVCLFCTFVCSVIQTYSYRVFFVIVSTAGLETELIFYLTYVNSLTDKIGVNWASVDFVASIVMACLSLICFGVACAYAGWHGEDAAASFFWILLFLLLCADCYYCFRARRGGKSGNDAPVNTGPSFFVEQPGAVYDN
ncbi:hypothetical protein Aperf_G00000132649 [Anoplocephala perfoliata]